MASSSSSLHSGSNSAGPELPRIPCKICKTIWASIGIMFSWKIFELGILFSYFLLSLLRFPIRHSKCKRQGTKSVCCTTDKDSSSVLFPSEGTKDMFALVTDARYPDTCLENGELSFNSIAPSWHSMRIRALQRDCESVRLELMLMEQEFSSVNRSQKEIEEMISDLKEFFFG